MSSEMVEKTVESEINSEEPSAELPDENLNPVNDEQEDDLESVEEIEEVEEVEAEEEKVDKPISEKEKKRELDDDQDRRNPQYIPKAGAFYEHDNRTLDDEEEAATAEADKKKMWKESRGEERWLHDCYNEDEQRPKTKEELMDSYGYDIRNEEAPPRARRRRKYGRGPEKYDRKWEDAQAYQNQRQVPRKGRPNRKREEYPSLPNQREEEKNERNRSKEAGSNPWRGPPKDTQPFKSAHVKSETANTKIRKDEVKSNQNNVHGQQHHHHSNAPGFHSGGRMEDYHIKPFRNDNDNGKLQKPKNAENVRANKFQEDHHRSPRNEKNMHGLNQAMQQMTLQSKTYNKSTKQELLSSQDVEPSGKVNPKRYSMIRKNYNPCFPPDELIELHPQDLEEVQQRIESSQQLQQQQLQRLVPQQQQQEAALAAQYAAAQEAYVAAAAAAGGHLAAVPQHQQAAAAAQYLAAQRAAAAAALLPAAAISPLAAAVPPPPPNFVPQPLYIDMEQHFAAAAAQPTAAAGATAGFAGYPAVNNQNTELYQASTGITYYSPEVQNPAGGVRALPVRRPKAAIPIVAPPETQ